MNVSQTSSRMMLLILAACLGLLLVAMPGWLLEQYDKVSEAGRVWVYVYFGAVGAGALLLLISTTVIFVRLWRRTRRKKARRRQRARNPSELTATERSLEVQENLDAVEDLRSDPAVDPPLKDELDQLVRQVAAKREKQRLEIVAFGTVSSGTLTLLNVLAGRGVFQTDPRGGTTVRRNEVPWPGMDQVMLVDTPGLGEIRGQENAAVSAAAARDADLVLVVVDGPLRQSEFELLGHLSAMEKRILICLNKSDWFDAPDKETLIGQIRDQVEAFVSAEDVVAVQAQPRHRTRMRMDAEGDVQEESVELPPDIAPLANRMMEVVRRDGRDLLLANLLLQSRGLVEEARRRVLDALDRRAREIVDKYTWAAGGAAALSPLPLLDLLAGGAVTTKMVFDLARVYRQAVDLDTVVNLLGQLGKNLIAILGVSAVGPAATSAIASMLKAAPGVGTIAGGVLQGLVQALITRWIGAVFIEYYKNEMREPEGGLTALARRQWDRMTSAAELYKLVTTARTRLRAPQEEESPS